MEYGFTKKLYPSQIKLINDVINTIKNNKMSIISSPTGTGKTLSLLCALSTFLNKNSEDENLFELFNHTSKTKIYYCSRTHSQLSQVINELKNCKNKYKSVILGSRKIYCINNTVNKITNIDILNDKCKELIRDDCCKYYGNEYYNQDIMDVEDLKNAGINDTFCPYYYSKGKASECEIVLLPYNLLFTVEGRRSADITLKNKIVIIDEAHNIYDTVIQLNSAELSWDTIKIISKANGLNSDITKVINSLLEFKTTKVEDKSFNETVFTVVDFLIICKIAMFNMLDLSDYIESNKIAQKNDMKSIFEFSKFLKLLTFSDDFGRIFITKKKIKFSCVDPKIYFEELKECSSVIFAGGTMEPIYNIKALFPEIQYFSYPAVNENFESMIISETVSGSKINFSYNYRSNQIDDVVNTLVALTNPVISGGILIFVPSKQVIDLIKGSLKTLNFRRKVYFEDNFMFDSFKSSPEILIAVMGGSLSEGINFSDDICRLLIVVGVPYPTKTLEIAERSKFVKDYETLMAMKTVNQTVGRSIRHKDDYAAIVFLDSRYVNLKAKLSPWLENKTRICKFSEGLININNFLKSQNKNL